MPKIVSRSAISSSIDGRCYIKGGLAICPNCVVSPPTDSATASLRVYYCLCGEFILVIDKSLNSLPRRKTDGAIIVRSQDAPNSKARVFKLNVNLASQPVMIERTPGPIKSGPFVYILWGSVSQVQGQYPPEAFEGEQEALATATAKSKRNNAS
ncbi:hypothetical protein RhiXN_04138 [Rhizoctonia solani]|uniref:STEEP1 domain-containing protein n=1 Tax=Rhizoctonia solani TaxID=456999 RepID=A0A8H8STC1_9AGAM|nr:uncharacterized protein RhiXN_04138 [Rhizoctonia solani]QRW16137.1 hypothetical protein RhiXN_04138 [Rhizoctonia solani]